MTNYSYSFSHQFEAGHSGPARSYWVIHRDSEYVLTLCLGPYIPAEDSNGMERLCDDICRQLEAAEEVGRGVQRQDFRRMLGL